MYIGNFEITKREVLCSISIIAIMMLIGGVISNAISEHYMDKNEVYNKAVKIETADMFEYGMRTNVGNAFVYGDLVAVDPVTYPEIGGEYMYVRKVEEHYERHTRQVKHTRTVNGKSETYYTTETYYSWDYAGSESTQCSKITFLGVEFPLSHIRMPADHHITTIKETNHVRFVYYGVDVKHTGTLFTELKANNISYQSAFYKGHTIDSAVDMLTANYGVTVFWIAWAMVAAFCVGGFVYMDNSWLE